MAVNIITLNDQERLAEIRMHLEKHRAMGFDVSLWEAQFFLDLIEKLRGKTQVE